MPLLRYHLLIIIIIIIKLIDPNTNKEVLLRYQTCMLCGSRGWNGDGKPKTE